jgi:hypothetical protein
MSDAGESVKALFPDAPEHCLECPALQAAVGRVQTWYMLSAEAVDLGIERGSLEDPEAAAKAEIVGEATTSEINRLQTELPELAKVLYENCTGPTLQDSRREVAITGTGRFGLQTTVKTEESTYYAACASSSPLAHLIPSQSSTYIPFTRPVKK